MCLILLGVLLCTAPLWAEATDGALSQKLAQGLYCDGRNLLTGNLGLILGLILVFSGLWSIVMGGGWISAIITIILGAAIPSIPGLVEGFLEGLGALLAEVNLTNKAFRAPICTTQSHRQAEDKSMKALDAYEEELRKTQASLCTGGYLDCR